MKNFGQDFYQLGINRCFNFEIKVFILRVIMFKNLRRKKGKYFQYKKKQLLNFYSKFTEIKIFIGYSFLNQNDELLNCNI